MANFTPPPELIRRWLDKDNFPFVTGTYDLLSITRDRLNSVITQAVNWGANQQLERDAKWLDTNALFSSNLTITPSGDALRRVMTSNENKSPKTETPLWLELRNHPRLFCLHPTPQQLAILLEEIADRIEYRGSIDYDRDPGETSDWLRREAYVANMTDVTADG